MRTSTRCLRHPTDSLYGTANHYQCHLRTFENGDKKDYHRQRAGDQDKKNNSSVGGNTYCIQAVLQFTVMNKIMQTLHDVWEYMNDLWVVKDVFKTPRGS